MTKTEAKPPYFYDGSLLLAEKVGSQIQKIYINDGQGIIGMVRPIYDGSTLTHYQRLYYLHDSLGSVSAVAGEHGLPLTGYKYTPYGTCMNVSNDPINNLQFVGRYSGYLDSDTGLTYFWHRWYDSSVGRWISRDPAGVNGGINLYGYVVNEPDYWVDPYGLCCWDPSTIIPTHGNYGGPGWTGGERLGGCIQGPPNFNPPPQDAIDICYKAHDRCYFDKCKKQWKCDVDLLKCLYNFGFGVDPYGVGSGIVFVGITPVHFITGLITGQ